MVFWVWLGDFASLLKHYQSSKQNQVSFRLMKNVLWAETHFKTRRQWHVGEWTRSLKCSNRSTVFSTHWNVPLWDSAVRPTQVPENMLVICNLWQFKQNITNHGSSTKGILTGCLHFNYKDSTIFLHGHLSICFLKVDRMKPLKIRQNIFYFQAGFSN